MYIKDLLSNLFSTLHLMKVDLRIDKLMFHIYVVDYTFYVRA